MKTHWQGRVESGARSPGREVGTDTQEGIEGRDAVSRTGIIHLGKNGDPSHVV